MPKTRPAYPAEFRRQMVDPVRAGRDPTDLARAFEPSGRTIRNWLAEVDRSEGRREEKLRGADPGPTTAERDELIRLRRENRQLKLERAVLSRALISLARQPGLRDSLACAGDRGAAAGVFRFMSANQADVPITVVARSGQPIAACRDGNPDRRVEGRVPDLGPAGSPRRNACRPLNPGRTLSDGL